MLKCMENPLIASYIQTIELLDELAKPLFEEYKPYLQCRKGCSGCCLSGFKIRYVEALYLLQGFLSATEDVRASILKNLQDASPETQMKCPVLVDGACALYDHRPALCRAYGLMIKLDDQTSTCALNFNDIPNDLKLKTFDIGLFYDLLEELSQKMWDLNGHSQGETLSPRLTIQSYLNLFLAEKVQDKKASQAAV